MLKKILAVLVMLYAAASFAAVDVNKATAADLDGIKGIGPTMSKRILDERRKGHFKSWDDLITRVKGVGEGSAAVYSKDGLTVNGDAFKGAAATRKEEKKAERQDKKDDKAAAKEAKKDAKADAKEAKAAAKEDKKAADKAVATAKPAAPAPAAKPVAAATPAKPAASGAKK
jgi:competence protein ComEA